MIVDSSALLAVVFREPGYEALLDRLLSAERKGIAAPTLVEVALVLTGRLGRPAETLVERLAQHFELMVIPFGEAHWRAAADAFARYGRGRHPAALNYGDCLSYAAAKLADRPLLYVGEDFGRTDLVAA